MERALPAWLFGVRSAWARLALAVAVPALFAVGLALLHRPGELRVSVVFVAPMVIVGVFAGWWALAISGGLSVLEFWYLAIPPTRSFALHSWAAAASVLLLVVVVVALTLLARRLEQAVTDVLVLDAERQAAVAREREARAAAERAADEAAALLRFAAALAGADTVANAAAAALDHLELPWPPSSLSLARTRRGGLEVVAQRGLDEEVLAELRATDVARSLWLAELFAGQAVFVDDRAAFAREHPAARVLELFDSGAWAVVPVRSTESVGLLSVHFPAPRPVSELQQYLELCAEILASAWQRASEREALEITLAERDRIASTLSTTLLPPKLPVVAGFEFSAWLEPGSADGVAGDFYDMFAPPQGGWLAVMGDVCGKGAEAAAVTSLARYAARAAALDNPDPAHIAQVVNDALIVDDSDLYATMAIVRYDEAAPGAVRVALAGHPQARLLSPAGIERLGDYGMPLGLFDGNVDVAVTAHEFPHGSTIVLFTDGLTERYPDLDDDALDRTLIAVTDHSAVSVCDALHRLVTTTSAPRIDDIAVLGATRLA